MAIHSNDEKTGSAGKLRLNNEGRIFFQRPIQSIMNMNAE
jgi:hypothetical protein